MITLDERAHVLQRIAEAQRSASNGEYAAALDTLLSATAWLADYMGAASVASGADTLRSVASRLMGEQNATNA